MKKIRIGYPFETTFEVKSTPKGFKYGCKKRTDALREFLSTQEPRGAMMYHGVGEFIVEDIERDGDTEYWMIGS